MATQYAFGKIVTDGLVLCLDAADRNSYVSGSTTWFDVAGSNNGTLTNGPTFNTGSGGNIVFDGGDDYVNLATTPPITTALTYTAWVNTIAFGGSNAVFNIRGTLFELNSGGLAWWSDVNQGSNGAGYSFTTGVWNFISVTQNNTSATLYINGNQVNSIAMPAINMSFGSSTFNFLGKYDTSRFLNARIGNASIYNRALSASEVLQNYNAQKSRFGL